jgi:hypothetical protein
MKIGIQLSLTLGTFVGTDLVNLFERFIRFEPYMFTRGSKTEAWNERKHRKAMQNYDGKVFLAFSDRKWNSVSAARTNTKHSFLSIRIVQEIDLFPPASDEMGQFLNLLPGLISAYLYNGEYVEIQSEKFETNLMRRQLPKEVLDSIKNTPFKTGTHGKEYEVRFNPGRSFFLDYSYLIAAWKIWLAPPFFALVSKDRVLSFPHAVEIKELPSGVVYVHLFERLGESHTPDSMFRQWKWQEWLDFDSLIENHDS